MAGMRSRELISLAAAAAAAAVAGCGSGSAPDHLTPPSRITVAVVGDLGMKQGGVATLEAMASARPDLYLALGDLSYAGPGSEDAFCRLVHAKVGRSARFEIIAGNHEDDTGGDGLIDNFAACLPDRMGASGQYGKQYYFDVGRLARFIMISPDLTLDGRYFYYGRADSGAADRELAWLEAAVADARKRGVHWVIVGMHKPCISVGVYYCDVYQDLFSALIRSGVDLVLSGHDHTYQRSKQLAAPRPGCRQVLVDHFDSGCVQDGRSPYRQGRGTVFVVAGSGGAPLYPVRAADAEAGYFAVAMGRNTPGKRHGFALLAISRRRLVLRFVASSPGSFGDHFVIARRAG